MNVGRAIKTLRLNEGMRQGEFARFVGISQNNLSRIENNKKKPTIKMLQIIADATETPLAVLFWFTVSEEEVNINKTYLFRLLKPIIDKLMYTLFNRNPYPLDMEYKRFKSNKD